MVRFLVVSSFGRKKKTKPAERVGIGFSFNPVGMEDEEKYEGELSPFRKTDGISTQEEEDIS